MSSYNIKMVPDMCILCFSSAHKLCNVGQKHIDIIRLLVEDPCFELPSASLCRECERRLLNVSQFKALVTDRMATYKEYITNGHRNAPPYKPTLVKQDITYVNMFVCQHKDLLDEDQTSPDALEDHAVDIKCEVEEEPVDIKEPQYFVEIIPRTTALPIDKKKYTTIDKKKYSTIDNSSSQQFKRESDKRKEQKLVMDTNTEREIPQDWDMESKYLIIWASDDVAKTWYETEKDKYIITEAEGQKYDPRIIRKKCITRCKICSTGFESVTDVYDHYKEHYIHYGCKLCDYKSRSLDEVKSHCDRYQHTENDGIDHTRYKICKKCGMAFITEAHAKRHRGQCYAHSYPCEHCGKSFSHRNSKYSHVMLNHKKMDSEICDICNKKCKNIFALRAHRRTHLADQKNEDDVFYCGPCDVHFKTKYSLEHHLRTSLKHFDKDEIHKLQCPHCPAKSLNSTMLKKHVDAVHLGIRRPRRMKMSRDVVCEVCGMNFKTNQVLINHMRSHSSDRPFKCDQCGATFKFRAALYTHNKLVHLKVKRIVKKKKRNEELQDN